MNIFLDTNIWVDTIMERPPFFLSSYKILLHVAAAGGRAGVSTITMVNVEYICHERGKMPSDEILHKWEGLLDVADVCVADKEDIMGAYDLGWSDTEDAMQYLCAVRWKADCIVTRNKKDFESSEIPVYTPEEFLSLEA